MLPQQRRRVVLRLRRHEVEEGPGADHDQSLLRPRERDVRAVEVEDELDALRNDQRIALLLRIEVDGLPVKDFAVEAGITSGNAAIRVFGACEALKKQIACSSGTCADHGGLACNFAARTCGS